ncbi:MAG: hypothetical protein [Podoviridae sp. ctbh1]|nr:MAG: hypothetical protein [Podoviridae sp. ctbh1]
MVGFLLFGVTMDQNNIENEIRKTEQELNHLGSCTTKGLTDEEIAQQDERFFLAIERLKWLKGRRDQKLSLSEASNEMLDLIKR